MTQIGLVRVPDYRQQSGSTCVVCGKGFNQKADARRHLESAHHQLVWYQGKRSDPMQLLVPTRFSDDNAVAPASSMAYLQLLTQQLADKQQEALSFVNDELLPAIQQAAARVAAASSPPVQNVEESGCGSAAGFHTALQPFMTDGTWERYGVMHLRLRDFSTPPKAQEYLQLGPKDSQVHTLLRADGSELCSTAHPLLGAFISRQRHKVEEVPFISSWEDRDWQAVDLHSPQEFVFAAQGLQLALLGLWLEVLPLLLPVLQQQQPQQPQQQQPQTQQQQPSLPASPVAGTQQDAAALLDCLVRQWPQQLQDRVREIIRWRASTEAFLQRHRRDAQQQQQQHGKKKVKGAAAAHPEPPALPSGCEELPNVPGLFLEALIDAAPKGTLSAMYAPLIDVRKLPLRGYPAAAQTAAAAASVTGEGTAAEGTAAEGEAAVAAASPWAAGSGSVLAALTGTQQLTSPAATTPSPAAKRQKTGPEATAAAGAMPLQPQLLPVQLAAPSPQQSQSPQPSQLQVQLQAISAAPATFFSLADGVRHPVMRVGPEESIANAEHDVELVSPADELHPGYVASLVSAVDHGLAGKALRVMPGMSLPVGILSSAATSALLHPEDAGFASYNINLAGATKVWYIVPPGKAQAFVAQLSGLMGVNLATAAGLAAVKTLLPLLPGDVVAALGVVRLEQEPGDVVLTAPGITFHVTLSLGVNLAESVNFMPRLTPAQQAAAAAAGALLQQQLQTMLCSGQQQQGVAMAEGGAVGAAAPPVAAVVHTAAHVAVEYAAAAAAAQGPPALTAAAAEVSGSAPCVPSAEAPGSAPCVAAAEAPGSAPCVAAAEAPGSAPCVAAAEAPGSAPCVAAAEVPGVAPCVPAAEASTPAPCVPAAEAPTPVPCVPGVQSSGCVAAREPATGGCAAEAAAVAPAAPMLAAAPSEAETPAPVTAAAEEVAPATVAVAVAAAAAPAAVAVPAADPPAGQSATHVPLSPELCCALADILAPSSGHSTQVMATAQAAAMQALATAGRPAESAAAAAAAGVSFGLAVSWARYLGFLLQGCCSIDPRVHERLSGRWSHLLLALSSSWEDAGLPGMAVGPAVQQALLDALG